MSKILSIETGTDICSIGLSEDGVLISLRESTEGRNHAANLALFVEDVLKQNSISANELDAVAVGIGPGSYTGLRIGVSLAKGMCYALNIPMIAIDSLSSLCKCAVEDCESGVLDVEIDDNTLLLPMIDARRMEVYTQILDNNFNTLTPIEAKIVSSESYCEYASKRLLMFGNGAKKCFDVIDHQDKIYCQVAPSVRGMVEQAHRMFDKKQFVDLAYFEPLYLKNFIGTKSTKSYFNK